MVVGTDAVIIRVKGYRRRGWGDRLQVVHVTSPLKRSASRFNLVGCVCPYVVLLSTVPSGAWLAASVLRLGGFVDLCQEPTVGLRRCRVDSRMRPRVQSDPGLEGFVYYQGNLTAFQRGLPIPGPQRAAVAP